MKIKLFCSLAALTFILGACNNDLIKQDGTGALAPSNGSTLRSSNASDFDYNASYWSASTLYSPYGGSEYVYEAGKGTLSVEYTLAAGAEVPPSWCYPVNNAFDDFQVWLYLGAGPQLGASYSSFCAYYYSESLGGDKGRIYVNKTDERFAGDNATVKENIISALSYIYDKYGSVDQWPLQDGSSTAQQSTKFIAQIAIWVLLQDGVADAKAYPEATWTTVNDAVADVLANYQGYKSTNTTTVTDIVFLADNDFTATNWAPLYNSQPQIVPLLGTTTPPKTLGPLYESVTATNEGNRPAIIAGLDPKTGNPFYNDKKGNPNTPFVVPNSNHFVYAVLNRADLADGVTMDMMVGNNYDIVGKAVVKLAGNNLEITIKDGVGSFGAVAFNQLPVIGNGNIHSAKAADLAKFGALTGFNHDSSNTAVIPCPAGNTIYLYLHCASMQFYQ